MHSSLPLIAGYLYAGQPTQAWAKPSASTSAST